MGVGKEELEPKRPGRVVFEGFCRRKNQGNTVLNGSFPENCRKCVLCLGVLLVCKLAASFKGSPRIESAIFKSDCQPMGQRSGNDEQGAETKKG